MNVYIIVEQRPATHTWTFQVTANSEEEAIAILKEGEGINDLNVTELDFSSDTDYETDANYYVESTKTK